jgi:signal transduction histidine kinase
MRPRLDAAARPFRAPWPFHVASLLTWVVVGASALVLVARRPGELAQPLWLLRAGLYLAWPVAGLAATAGALHWNVPRRVVALAVQSAAALGLLATAPSSPAVMLLFPVAGAAPFLLPARGAIGLVSLQTLALGAIYASVLPPLQAAVTTICTVGGEVFGLSAGHLAVTERRARLELARLHAALQATQGLLAQSVREGERLRISRDLHDTLGHDLAVLSVNLEVAAHLAGGKVADHVGQARALARRLLSDVRDVVETLHDERAIDLGSALATLAAGVPEPRIHLALPGELRISDPGLAHAVFRCVQEIVTNTVRHAEARNLWIEIRHGPGGLAVEARDDGRGVADYRPGRGLQGMGERLRELGGSLVVASHPGRGFEVRATLPFPQAIV